MGSEEESNSNNIDSCETALVVLQWNSRMVGSSLKWVCGVRVLGGNGKSLNNPCLTTLSVFLLSIAVVERFCFVKFVRST